MTMTPEQQKSLDLVTALYDNMPDDFFKHMYLDGAELDTTTPLDVYLNHVEIKDRLINQPSIIVIFDPENGFTVPDSKVEVFVDTIIAAAGEHNYLNYKVVVGSDIIVNAFRAAIAVDTVANEDVAIIFNDRKLDISNSGAYLDFPRGYPQHNVDYVKTITRARKSPRVSLTWVNNIDVPEGEPAQYGYTATARVGYEFMPVSELQGVLSDYELATATLDVDNKQLTFKSYTVYNLSDACWDATFRDVVIPIPADKYS